MPELIDTHVHLDHPKLWGDLEQVISYAQTKKVTQMINIGHDMASSRASLALASQWKNIWATVGVHPHSAKDMIDSDLVELEEMAANSRIIAIGEIGLDYHYDFSPRKIQRDVFRRQLELAKGLDLPIIIHQREAVKDTLDLLEASGPWPRGGVMHCFSGSVETMYLCLDLGLHIGLGGPVTFTNARKAKDVAKLVPLDRVLLETDCPYLAPTPHRGKTNQPGYLPLVAQEIARIKSMPVDDIVQSCTTNAKNLFRLEV
jgi:TatD DNase family protein